MLRGICRGSLIRLLHTTSVSQSANTSKALLGKLRKETGFSFVNCKKALQICDGDLEKAKAWLTEQAQKEGWVKATKLQGRAMSQGLVGVILEDNKGVMVEVNCETDFVARNVKFQHLVHKIANSCMQHSKTHPQQKTLLNTDAVRELKIDENQKIADLMAVEIGNLGENMCARRAAFMSAPDHFHLGSYIHSAGSAKIQSGKCFMGKYGAFAVFKHDVGDVAPSEKSDDTEKMLTTSDLGRQLCQHIVGMNPINIGSPPPSTDENNKDIAHDGDSEVAHEDKETESEVKKRDETLLLHQEFLMDTSLSVHEFLTQNKAEVVDFVRFECGEEDKQ